MDSQKSSASVTVTAGIVTALYELDGVIMPSQLRNALYHSFRVKSDGYERLEDWFTPFRGSW